MHQPFKLNPRNLIILRSIYTYVIWIIPLIYTRKLHLLHVRVYTNSLTVWKILARTLLGQGHIENRYTVTPPDNCSLILAPITYTHSNLLFVMIMSWMYYCILGYMMHVIPIYSREVRADFSCWPNSLEKIQNKSIFVDIRMLHQSSSDSESHLFQMNLTYALYTYRLLCWHN